MNVVDLRPTRPLLAVVPDYVADAELSVDELGSRIVGLAGRLAAATSRWLLLIAAFDAREGFARYGLSSTYRWLSHYCGLSRRTAIEHVRVARALAAHPPLAEAMQAGRLSFSQARAISRLADLAAPQLIADLVTVAEHGTVGQLEVMVRGLRTVDDNNRDALEPDPETVSHRWRSDSRFGFSAKLDPEHGALLQSAIETIARREDLTHAEALTRMAEIALASVSAAGDGPAPALRGDEHAAVVIHLDAAPAGAGAEGSAPDAARQAAPAAAGAPGCSAEHPRPAARIAGGPGLPPRVVERLACCGRLRTIVFDPRVPLGEAPCPLDVGAAHRLVSDKQFRALLIRDGGCAHPGCGSRLALEAHHVKHWLHGGKTVLANLVLLCRRHHHTHHDGQFVITPTGGGRYVFATADGAELPRRPEPSRSALGRTPIEEEHPDVAPDAATTRWDGTRLDRDYAVAALAQGLQVVQGRSA